MTRFMTLGLFLVTSAYAGDSTLDLGDLAVGGDGFGSAPVGLGLKVQTGQLVPNNVFGGSSTGGPLFRPIDGTNGSVNIAAVDGVLLADGNTQIDSTGTLFPFPNTGGTQFDAIRNAAAVYDNDANPPQLRPIVLNDQPGVARRGIGVHSNGGITFDLDAIREFFPAITAVQGVAGISAETNGFNTNIRSFIIVDGQTKFEQVFSGIGLNNMAFNIPVSADDRFVTFAVADNGSLFFDHGVFADAMLVPEPTTLTLLGGLILVFGCGRRRG